MILNKGNRFCEIRIQIKPEEENLLLDNINNRSEIEYMIEIKLPIRQDHMTKFPRTSRRTVVYHQVPLEDIEKLLNADDPISFVNDKITTRFPYTLDTLGCYKGEMLK